MSGESLPPDQVFPLISYSAEPVFTGYRMSKFIAMSQFRLLLRSAYMLAQYLAYIGSSSVSYIPSFSFH